MRAAPSRETSIRRLLNLSGSHQPQGLTSMAKKPLLVPEATTKQVGDAAEYLTAGMMTLAGMPTTVMPDNWPDYDLITQPPGDLPQRINVKSRREKFFDVTHKPYTRWVQLQPDGWDWFVFVWVPKGKKPRFWVIPNEIIRRDIKAQANGERRVAVRTLERLFNQYEDNFALRRPARPVTHLDKIVLKAA